MSTIKVDFSQKIQKIKPMNCVNNGPIVSRSDQCSGNFEAYKDLRIPYARNHDASFCSSYGGQFTVDVNAIFPNFDADENDPQNYDFGCTDKYIKDTLDAGTETFYRLGSKIEHEIVKHNTKPPKDFYKWARICDHIISHYNEKWADGFEYNITYWEIWNEPDGWENDPPELRQTWGGTRHEFFDLFEITAKYLKEKHPNIKIGGPALGAGNSWPNEFLACMSERNAPLDFFSWHSYTNYAEVMVERALKYRAMLDKHGFNKTESHCNEWAYVKNWTDKWVYTLETIRSLKGSAYVFSVMQQLQNAPVDMLMYYDARPGAMNGLFDFYDYSKLKTYYSFIMWRDLAEKGMQVKTETDNSDLYAITASNGKTATACVSYYSDDDTDSSVRIATFEFAQPIKNGKVYLLDEKHDLEYIGEFSGTHYTNVLTRNSSIEIEIEL